MRRVIENYIERLMSGSRPDCPLWNIEKIEQGKELGWNYIDGCMMTSLLCLWRQTGERRYFDFVESFIDYYVFEDGTLRGYDLETYNLDNICEGRVLFDLYRETGKEKYAKAIELLHMQLEKQPRTIYGSFWHKQIYPHQVWLDGLYMAQVFSTRYQVHSGANDFSDIISQFRNVRTYMFDDAKQLYYHGFDASKTAFWAKPDGCSKSFWLRSLGWYLVALTDVIDYLPEQCCEERGYLSKLLDEALRGIMQYRDAESGMFMQVVDAGRREGNYPESSGSSMIAYACLKGARIGAVAPSFSQTGESIFKYICEYCLSGEGDNLNLGSICLVAGLGPENNRRRDGTFEYYISEPVVENDAKGVAPFIMSFVELNNIK